MVDNMVDNVAIPRNYLESLLRRAALHGADNSVQVTVTQYKSLTQDARRYHCLKAALLAGGASEATLEVLIDSQTHAATPPHDTASQNYNSCHEQMWDEESSLSTPEPRHRRHRQHNLSVDTECLENTLAFPSPHSNEYFPKIEGQYQQGGQYMGGDHGDRSLVVTEVPVTASVFDITKVISGGMILKIYIRRRERACHVAFVNSEAAVKFVSYAKRQNLVINGEHLKVSWDEQQAYLPGYIMNCVLYKNATRNLVLRFVPSTMTAESIREDLDHIHRLEALHIRFENGHAWLHLNSIQNAINAKNCMQSRLKYKHLRIEFFPDECDRPLPTIETSIPQKQSFIPDIKQPVVSVTNRFHALSTNSFDGSENSDESDDESHLIAHVP